MDEGPILAAGFPCLAAMSIYFRRKRLKFIQIYRCPEQEHAAVPRISTFGKHGESGLLIRLFNKTDNSETVATQRLALSNIAESGLRTVGGNAESNDMTFPGKIRRLCHSFVELLRILEHMI